MRKNSAEEWKENPFTVYAKNWAIVSAANKEGKVNGMTVSWGNIGTMWGMDAATVYIRESRYTKEFVDDSEYFSISFPNPEKYRKQLEYFGTVSGRSEDKFAVSGLNVEMIDGVPAVADSEIVLICCKKCRQPLEFENINSDIVEKWYSDKDKHIMYIGLIEKILVR